MESFAVESFAVAALMPGVARAVADLANVNVELTISVHPYMYVKRRKKSS